MIEPFDRLDEAYYQTIVDTITDSFPWTRIEGSPTVEEVVRRAAAGPSTVGELALSHLYTDADLRVQLPDYRNGNAARLDLHHSLDGDIPSKADGFIGALGRSHGTIAETYRSEYIQPIADPNLVLCGCVPVAYTDQKVYSMLTAITTIALRIQRLHEDIRSPITEVLLRGPLPPNGSSVGGDRCTSTGR